MPGETTNFVPAILITFPILFIALWLGVVTLLASLGGWNRLQERYADRPDTPLLSLRMQSGQLGSGSPFNPFGNVSYNGCLRFDVCHTGLRVSVWKIFGPFQRPFLVPWSEISASEKSILFFTRISLRLGQMGSHSLIINRRAFAAITKVHPLPLLPS